MTGKYASSTEVTANRSRDEIERTLTRYGATQFAYGWDGPKVMIGFQMHDRHIRFVLTMPDLGDFEMTPTGRWRTANAARETHEQAIRQRWRALALVIKAKLEAVDSGIETFDSIFLANIVLPDGRTYGDFAVPQVNEVYRTQQMPAMLPGLDETPALPGARIIELGTGTGR